VPRSGTPERAGVKVAGVIIIQIGGFVLAQALMPDGIVEVGDGSVEL